ncbi:MAG: alkaline phosphatase [Gammaproteobacteria bacterium]|nr:alkaline phosphatase [Gammaproteobacteria bacterium]
MIRQALHLKLFLIISLLHFLVLFSFELVAEETTADTRNVILIIGDGMGPQQIGLLEAYVRQAPDSVIKDRTSAFTRILNESGQLGMSMTNAANSLSVDSACSASQIALGKPVRSEMIGLDAKGEAHDSVLMLAKKMGKSTGLVSNVRLTHATPAAFAAHQPHRSLENEIAVDMLRTGADVMLSGGLRHWIPQNANDKSSALFKKLQTMTGGNISLASKRKDDRNLLAEAEKLGYQLAFTKEQMERSEGRILGLFASSSLPDGIAVNRSKNREDRNIPTLTEMSKKALATLSKNKNGFFLMIEAGLIDWAAHYNDTGTMLHEMLDANEMLNSVLDWAKQRDDTLIVVTADHETGGFGFSYSSANLPKSQKLATAPFQNTVFKPNFNYGNPLILDKLYNQQLSYTELFNDKFDTLPDKEQTPYKLKELVNRYTSFEITEFQAARILEKKNNSYYVKNHKSLDHKVIPNIKVNEAFFSYPVDDNRRNLLAVEVASSQSVVWSNGNHTATPVLVFSKGSKKAMAPFSQLMDHSELGRKLIAIVTSDK